MTTSANSLDFRTKYGNVKITAPTSSETPLGFPDVDIRGELNTVEIDDNPYNTYGLASKIFVTEAISAHDVDKDAHSDLFNSFLTKLYDLYDKQGELRIRTLSDEYDNKIHANRRVIINGDEEHPKYLVTSEDKHFNVDELLNRVIALENALASVTEQH